MKKFVKAIAAIMLTVAVFFAAGCTKTDEPNNDGGSNGGGDGDGSLSGYAYVDLGLPSGTLWATCNVGADTPEGYGDYFAWGETQPKMVYDWSSYKYYIGSSSTESFLNADSWTKYKEGGAVLEAIDDAATVNWGDGWHMPSCEQWDELVRNTTGVWTTQNRVKGLLLTASNGHSLFLPASSDLKGDNPPDIGRNCMYWSNKLYGGCSYARYFEYYDEDSEYEWDYYLLDFHMEFMGRPTGMSVRPVCY